MKSKYKIIKLSDYLELIGMDIYPKINAENLYRIYDEAIKMQLEVVNIHGEFIVFKDIKVI